MVSPNNSGTNIWRNSCGFNVAIMRTIILVILFGLSLLSTDGQCQRSKESERQFGQPFLTDSVSTLFIPTRYSETLLASNKIAFWGDYYANIIVYNASTDTYKKLFEKDTYIESFKSGVGYAVRPNEKVKNITPKWVLLLVKHKDTNGNGRIDEKDPSMLFAVSLDGQILKQLTDEKVNVVSFDTFEKQGFAFLKIQRDVNNDRSFKDEDDEFFFKKVSLVDLTLGNGIEIK